MGTISNRRRPDDQNNFWPNTHEQTASAATQLCLGLLSTVTPALSQQGETETPTLKWKETTSTTVFAKQFRWETEEVLMTETMWSQRDRHDLEECSPSGVLTWIPDHTSGCAVVMQDKPWCSLNEIISRNEFRKPSTCEDPWCCLSVCTRVVVHLHTFLSIGWYIRHLAWQCSYGPICLYSQGHPVYKVISQLLPNVYHRRMGISSDYHIQIWLWSLRGAVRSWFLIRRWAAAQNCLRMASSLQSLPLCLRELRSLFRSSPVMKCCNLLSRCSFLPLAGLVFLFFTKWLPTQDAFQQSPDNRPELRLFVEGIVCVGGERGGGSEMVFVFLLFWSRQGQNHTYYNSGFVTALHSDPHELFFFGYF